MFGKLDEEAPFIKAGLPLGGVDADGAPLVCRICFEESEDTADLISPCRCKGARGMPVNIMVCQGLAAVQQLDIYHSVALCCVELGSMGVQPKNHVGIKNKTRCK